MKSYKIPAHNLGEVSLVNAFNLVFGEKTLKETHSNFTSTPWQNNKRTTSFYIQLEVIPRVLKRFVSANGINTTVQQSLSETNDYIKVSNDIKLNLIGSQFFKIDSFFELQKINENIYMTGEVQCNAYLLPPLNIIAESFILSQCKKEIHTYTEIVTNKFLTSLNLSG